MIASERIVDLFAGGGGASTGIELALGRSPNVAINHDAEAVAMHEANHPRTVHLCGDIWDYDPRAVVDGPVGLLWASPDCKHFSKAKGASVKRSKKIRSLGWSVVRYARTVKPLGIFVENVEEFQGWGPLTKDGVPDPKQKGVTFRRWVAALRACGYVVEWRELRACDYGAPTTRKRLFVIARCDGQPIVWPEPTHGPGRLPYRTAADCIDWTIPVPSIFDRAKPLAEATLRRIARGIRRFVLDTGDPFVTQYNGTSVGQRLSTPLATVTTRDRFGLVVPTLIQTGYGERRGQAPRSLDLHAPLGTVVAGGAKHALVCAFLAKHYGGRGTPGSSLANPVGTITCTDHHALVSVYARGEYSGVIRHAGKARKLLRAFNPGFANRSSRSRGSGFVTVEGQRYEIVDIGMRMLTPRELFRAQGFPDSYTIDPVFNGKRLSASAQVRMCGNSVSPVVAKALVCANFGAAARVAA